MEQNALANVKSEPHKLASTMSGSLNSLSSEIKSTARRRPRSGISTFPKKPDRQQTASQRDLAPSPCQKNSCLKCVFNNLCRCAAPSAHLHSNNLCHQKCCFTSNSNCCSTICCDNNSSQSQSCCCYFPKQDSSAINCRQFCHSNVSPSQTCPLRCSDHSFSGHEKRSSENIKRSPKIIISGPSPPPAGAQGCSSDSELAAARRSKLPPLPPPPKHFTLNSPSYRKRFSPKMSSPALKFPQSSTPANPTSFHPPRRLPDLVKIPGTNCPPSSPLNSPPSNEGGEYVELFSTRRFKLEGWCVFFFFINLLFINFVMIKNFCIRWNWIKNFSFNLLYFWV